MKSETAYLGESSRRERTRTRADEANVGDGVGQSRTEEDLMNSRDGLVRM